MTSSFELTVRYAETDAQGVVHHRNYLTWFEEGVQTFYVNVVSTILRWSS